MSCDRPRPGQFTRRTVSAGDTGIGLQPRPRRAGARHPHDRQSGGAVDPAIASRLASCGVTWLDAAGRHVPAGVHYLGLDTNSIARRPARLRGTPHARCDPTSVFALVAIRQRPGEPARSAFRWVERVAPSGARPAGAEAAEPVDVASRHTQGGRTLWTDMFAIRSMPPHPENAYTFLDYLMGARSHCCRHERGRAGERECGLSCPRREEIRQDPTIYPTMRSSNA